MICAALMVTALVSFPLNAEAKNGNTGSTSLKVDYHTKEEIAEYAKNHPYGNADKNDFASVPSYTEPYSAGRLSDSTLNDACVELNVYRYIAGVPEVSLNDDYIDFAQNGCYLDSVTTYVQLQPSFMNDEMYQKGYEGSTHSIKGYGFVQEGDPDAFVLNDFTLDYAMTRLWMAESDPYVYNNLQHRRYLLNPYMSQTGFGITHYGRFTHASVYVGDEGNLNGKDYSVVAWPAQNTPTGYFFGGHPWSLSIDDNIQSATVTMTCENTGKKWVFSGESNCDKNDSTGYFNIDTYPYGQKACIIFKPAEDIDCGNGVSYKISVSAKGSKQYSIEYTVDFFNGDEYLSRDDVVAFVKRFYKEVLGRSQEDIDKDAAGVDDWSKKLVSGQESGADVAYGFVTSTEFKKRDLNNAQFLTTMYKAFFDREPDADGYNEWYTKLQNGEVSREQVVAGFTNSPEFVNLCNKYRIYPGSIYISTAPKHASALKPLNIDTTGVDEDQLDAFVERLYNKALERPSDKGGKEYWKGCILDGHDADGRQYDIRTVISIGFLNSQEYKNRDRNNAEFVLDCYAAFFDRSPIGHEDEPNYWDWVQQLNDGKITRQQMIERGFGDSQEFRNLIRSYGFVIK